MIRIPFSEADLAALRYWRFHHPDPRVQVRMEALYLRSQGVANHDILQLCDISKASFHRYLTAYVTGGLEQLKHLEPRRPRSALHHHCTTLEAEFRQRPPATVAAAIPGQGLGGGRRREQGIPVPSSEAKRGTGHGKCSANSGVVSRIFPERRRGRHTFPRTFGGRGHRERRTPRNGRGPATLG